MAIGPKQIGKVYAQANLAASGAIAAGQVVESLRAINVAQITAALTHTLTAPTDANVTFGLDVNNTGTASFTLYGLVVPAGNSARYAWNGTAWVPPVPSVGAAPAMTGATANGATAGTAGSVPTPAAGFAGTLLRGNAAFGVEDPVFSATEYLQVGAVRYFQLSPGNAANGMRGPWRYLGAAGVPTLTPNQAGGATLWEPLNPSQVAISMSQGSATNLPSGAITNLDMTASPNYIRNSMADLSWDNTNKGIKVPYSGVYLLQASFGLTAGTATGERRISSALITNSSTVARQVEVNAPGTTSLQFVQVNDVMTTAAGTLIGATVYQTSGTAQTVSSARLSAVLLSLF